MVEITYQMVLSTLQTVGILVGIFYYVMTLRNAQKDRMIEMVFQRTQTRTPEYFENITEVSPMMSGWNTVDEFYQKYNVEKTPKLMAKRSSINSNLSAWGYLLREDLVDVDFVCRFNTPIWIIRWYEVNEPLILRNRSLHDPENLKDFEFLYRAVKAKYPDIDVNSKRAQDYVIERMRE
jgi:hypothetical protein